MTTKGAEDIIDFKCNENAQNYVFIPVDVEKMEQTKVNLNSIANVLNIIPDAIQQFLLKLRETINFLATQNKKTIALNMGFGHLWFFPDFTVEFKVAEGNKEQLKPSLIPFKPTEKSQMSSKKKNGSAFRGSFYAKQLSTASKMEAEQNDPNCLGTFMNDLISNA